MNPRVLVVDDSLTVRMDLEEAFTEAGFAPVPCADLASARRALGQDHFALAILDILLPDGDGIDLLKEIKGNPATADVPVLLLSTEAEVRDRVRGLATGADDYVGKPYDRRYVMDRARELLRPQTRPPEPRAAPLVLVIEDSLTFREELREALEARGYVARTAETGEEGLRLASQLRPNAVVVDGHLPGIDGATVVRRLRSDAALRRIPCLLLTASEEWVDELRSLDAGADMFVRKDEGKEIILARLAAVLRSAVEPAAVEVESPLFGPKRVLAVDDSLTFLHEVTGALRQEEYEVIQAHSGEEALELLAVQPVDCILLDLVMPGLSGEETCRRIKNTSGWQDIPVVILTARKDLDAILGCLNAGADDYVPKSSEFELIKARLRAQLRRKQYEGELHSGENMS
jgi:DNA-binding response OmpR family regulator